MTVVKSFKSYVDNAHESMIYAVISGCLNPSRVAITNSVPAFAGYINGLQTNMNMVTTLRNSIALPIVGIAAENKAQKALIAKLSADIMLSVYSYAVDNGMLNLAGQMHFSTSDLVNKKNLAFVSCITEAMAVVSPLVASLGDYNVTAAMVSSVQTLIADYATKVTDPRNAITFRKSVNQQIQFILRNSMNTLINQCDKLALQFRATELAYYFLYKDNRKLVPHHMSTQLRAHIFDQDGQPIMDGEVFIVGTDRSGDITDGYCLVDLIPPGEHEVAITTPWGTVTNGPFMFRKGKSLSIDFLISTEEGKVSAKVTKTSEADMVTAAEE